MRRPRVSIPQRRRVFLGCEGESERGYGALLAQLLEHRRKDMHLDVVLLRPGGGDPLSLVERAVKVMRQRERASQMSYVLRGLLIDADTLGRTRARDVQIPGIATAARLELVWQSPCHEALLLRHLAGCELLRPATSAQSWDALVQRWPQYVKAMPALRLAERIQHAELERASHVEPELQAFLRALGYLA